MILDKSNTIQLICIDLTCINSTAQTDSTSLLSPIKFPYIFIVNYMQWVDICWHVWYNDLTLSFTVSSYFKGLSTTIVCILSIVLLSHYFKLTVLLHCKHSAIPDSSLLCHDYLYQLCTLSFLSNHCLGHLARLSLSRASYLPCWTLACPFPIMFDMTVLQHQYFWSEN